MKKYFGVALLLTILLTACNKQNELLKISALSDYYPLQLGKYITYNLDSTVFISFGTKDTIIKYQVKDSVSAQITDNLGRPAFRILRLIRKDATQAWVGNNTFMAIPTANSIEFVEDNLRFIKLILPIQEGVTWKGNSYLTHDPYPNYVFASAFMNDWDYTYQDVNFPISIGSYNLNSTITVFQNESSDTAIDATGIVFAQKTYSIEKYAKGIGLVYKEFFHSEYQGNINASKGFGIKLTMIDHN